MTRFPRIAWRIYLTGAAVAALTFTFTDTFFKNETQWDDAFAGAFVALLVVGFMYQRELNKKEIEKQRFQAFRATMTTVQDIVGNFLNSIQLVRMECDGVLPEQSIELFDHLIAEASAHLKALAELDHVHEKPMAIGAGIAYPLPQLPDHDHRSNSSKQAPHAHV
jgi:hypothetical protein